MIIDIRIIATIIYLFAIITTLKNAEGYDPAPRFYLPFWAFIYAVFWIIWLNLN